VTVEDRLARLCLDAVGRVPDLPAVDQVIEDSGRQRLAAYYLYSALLAGLIGPADLAPDRWPPELAEPLRQRGLSRLAPETGRALDAQLSPAEQATRRSPGRRLEFAQLLVELVNGGSFGPLCLAADRVRLADDGEEKPGSDLELELIKGGRVAGTCPVRDHWELVAQHLAGAPLDGDGDGDGDGQSAGAGPGGPGVARATWTRRLSDTAIPHAVSLGVAFAVSVHPLGTIAGEGTRLIRARIGENNDQADALGRLGRDLATLRAEADGELAELATGRSNR
jgi:hypothetical protein